MKLPKPKILVRCLLEKSKYPRLYCLDEGMGLGILYDKNNLL